MEMGCGLCSCLQGNLAFEESKIGFGDGKDRRVLLAPVLSSIEDGGETESEGVRPPGVQGTTSFIEFHGSLHQSSF